MSGLFITFTNSLVSLALCIAVGFFCRRRQLFDDTHVAGMLELLVKVAMPCAVFMSLMRPFTTALLLESIATFFITGGIFLVGGLLGLGVARLMKASIQERQSWRFGLTFGNIGFMGIPVITAVFGYEGLFYVAMALAAFNLITFTIGIKIFDTQGTIKTGPIQVIINNPALAGTILGFIFFLTGLRLPAPIEGGVSLIAYMNSPLSMILIGALLAKQPIKETFTDIRVLPPNAVKLIVIPIASLLILRWFIPNPVMLGTIVTLMAMPPAANTAIFAEQFGSDSVAATRLVIVGTLLCVVTVPLISLLL
ncbi:MAG: AEC family transporter [Defluviitaleaceae bacterium]|nr:AEC family transporter [Defluviitaleaceae bacterium]